MNLIDFHVHGKGSFFKDKFANASYDDMCAYFQGIAEEEGKDVVVAFTEHDNVAITYDEYKKLSEKYPNVKIVLGMECNTKLTYSTNGLFEQAHVLVYADMSSEEGIKKWFDCKELQALSKLNTFTVRFPTPFMKAKKYVEEFNKTFGMRLNAKAIASVFEKYKPTDKDKFRTDFLELLAKQLYSNKEAYSERGGYFYKSILDKKYNHSTDVSKIKFKDVLNKLYDFGTSALNDNGKNKYLGSSLYILKNVLGKYLNLKISNEEFAKVLDGAKSYEQMRNLFLKFTKYKIQKHNPALYNKIKDLSPNEFANYELGDGGYGKIILNNFFPRNLTDKWAIDKSDVNFTVRTRLSELNTIAEKTGGYLMLAHPNSMFTYNQDTIFTGKDMEFISESIFSKTKYSKLKKEIKSNKSMPMQGIFDTSNNALLKLDLFLNICKKNGIKFTGFEITKDDLRNKHNLVNKLIYAAKNDYEVSFGSDTHLSKIVKYYNLLKQNKIDEATFTKLKAQLVSKGDTIASENAYKKLYGKKFGKSLNITSGDSYAHKLEEPLVKKYVEEPIYAAKQYNRVVQTSFADKIFGINQHMANKPMLTLNIKDDVYSFDKEDLKRTDYLKVAGDKKTTESTLEEQES